MNFLYNKAIIRTKLKGKELNDRFKFLMNTNKKFFVDRPFDGELNNEEFILKRMHIFSYSLSGKVENTNYGSDIIIKIESVSLVIVGLFALFFMVIIYCCIFLLALVKFPAFMVSILGYLIFVALILFFLSYKVSKILCLRMSIGIFKKIL